MVHRYGEQYAVHFDNCFMFLFVAACGSTSSNDPAETAKKTDDGSTSTAPSAPTDTTEDSACSDSGNDLSLVLPGDGSRAENANSVFPLGDDAAFTIEAWVYLTENDNNHYKIFSDDSFDLNYVPNYKGSGPAFDFNLWSSCNASTSNIFYKTLPLNTWAHIAASYDPQTQKVVFAIDGEVESRDITPLGGFCTDEAYAFTIGDLKDGSDYPFIGKIDELRISNIVRYALGYVPDEELVKDSNTKALWRFDEKVGCTVPVDISDDGNVLTFVGNAAIGE